MVLVSIFVFSFGLGVGSFLNAVIYRLEKGESALQGRSYCPHCKHSLAWYDLIPVLSFAMLGGKCRYCKRRISIQYPIVEISTGLIFLFIFNFSPYGRSPEGGQFFNLFYLWTVASLLIVLFVYDLRYYILPDKILFPAIGIVFAYRVFEVLNLSNWDLFRIWDLGFGISAPLAQALFAALGASSFFFLIFLISRGAAMGFGDVKLAFFLGFFLGWPNILVALFAAFFAGAIIGLILIALGKKGLKSEIPFGPFLIGGTFVALFWGKGVVDWYLDMVLV